LINENYEEYGVTQNKFGTKKDRSSWYHHSDWQYKFDQNMKKIGY
jgi:hypothetical protein